MSRLVIAIDCDDVLITASAYVVSTYNQRYGTNVLLEHAHISGNDEWQADRGEVFRRLSEIQHSNDYARIAPPADAIEVVRRLSKRHELHLVTARPRGVIAVTERMLDRYFPKCFSSVNHLGPDQSKGNMCTVLQADVLVDDNLRHLRTAKECGVQGRLWFGEYPWQIEDDPTVYTKHVKNWYEVEAEIEQIAGGGVRLRKAEAENIEVPVQLKQKGGAKLGVEKVRLV